MSTNVAPCLHMSTYVAPKKNLGRFPCDLPNSSSPSLMDTARTIWGHFTAFQLTAFTFKFSMGESSGFSNRAPRLSIKRAHKGALPESGGRYRLFFSLMRLSCGEEQSRLSSDASLAHAGRPQRVPIRFRQPYEALHQFDAIILGQVDLSRSKSIQSRVFPFFLDFFLDFADVSSNLFRQPHKVCPNALQLPWVRAGFDGLCRIMTDYDGVFPFFRPLHACVRRVSSMSLMRIGR